MTQPESTDTLDNPSHSQLHRAHLNVKAFDATGDGVTDDTDAIQAAVDAAQAVDGPGHIYFPQGNYVITSTITLDGGSVRLSGPVGPRIAESNDNGAVISANFTGPMFYRSLIGESDPMVVVIFEDLTFVNFHNTGAAIKLGCIEAGSGVYRCHFQVHKAIEFTAQTFDPTVSNSSIHHYGTVASSIGIKIAGHTSVFNCDVVGYEIGIQINGRGVSITGGRYEVNYLAIQVTGSGSASIVGFYMEGNDKGIQLMASSANLIAMGCIFGHGGSPSGGSLIGITIADESGCTITAVSELGTHATAFIQCTAGLDQSHSVTFLGVNSASPWVFAQLESGHQIINCTGVTDVVRSPVVATASLPAAGTTQNGRTIIEDAGTGNRNLIIYAGGQRFRIDGGANV